MIVCPLCLGDKVTKKLQKKDQKTYWDCEFCRLIFLDPNNHLPSDLEKAHYENHNNDVTDPGYQKFVSPIVDYVATHISKETLGLDFGSGKSPATAAMLTKKGYHLKLFDPYFNDDLSALTYRYDYIISCEVIEHFNRPMNEFNKIKYLLNPSGKLILMTDVYDDDVSFDNWYYHQDPTHVAFYRKETFHWIARNFGFNELKFINKRTIVLGQ